MSILSISNLGKVYNGRCIFKGVNLNLAAGVYALRGANGTGKSTLLRLLAGVIKADVGFIHVKGHRIDLVPDAAKSCIGYMADGEDFYDFVTPNALWQLIASARGAEVNDGRALADRLDLTRYIDRPLGALSQGTRRKIFLVGAFLGSPALVLLDEPSNALDVSARRELGRMIEIASSSAVVLMSTHDIELVSMTSAQVLHLTEQGIKGFDKHPSIPTRGPRTLA